MDTDSDEEPAQHEKVAVDHTRDLASKTIPARDAGIGTDVDASDHEQASEMELTSASTNAAEDIGNNRADEERGKAVRSVAEAAGRRTLRARPVAPKVQNEYAKPYKTTAAARRERRPNIISLLKWKLKRASEPRQAGPEMFEIWESFQHP